MNKKIVAFTILILLAFATIIVPLEVIAQNANVGVFIAQVSPDSLTGPVGTAVNIQGSIYSPNNTYQIYLGKNLVTTGTSEGYFVDANFTVPEVTTGLYALLLRDVAINRNYTSQFNVTTGYAINAIPSSVQEGSGLTLNVTVTGGQAGTSYNANVAVALPSPLGTLYSKTVALGTPNAQGTANAQVTFPDSSFDPTGSQIGYVGTYSVYFNKSQSLAQNTFSVNIIDSTTYHRGQTIKVQAVGYQPNEVVSLVVLSLKTGATLDTTSVTASADGVINTNWVVPATLDVGDYRLQLNPTTAKSIVDLETFTVAGYPISTQTVNLAGEVVPGIVIKVLDQSTSTQYNATSGSDGFANFTLEAGTHVFTVFWNDVDVGETTVNINGAATLTLICQLTDVKFTVKNADGIMMPGVNLKIAYVYQSGGAKTGSSTGVTDASGSFTLTSALPGATYTIDASLYNQVFNAGNNSLGALPNQANSQVFIICPSESILLNIVGYNQEPIPNARLELVELSNGLFYSATADINGSLSTQATFGMYRARIYKDSTLINETNMNVFGTVQQQTRCTLFGIQLSVSVVDFFGNAISKATVTLNGPEKLSQVAQNDGKTTFNNIIGGNIQVIAQASGTKDAYQAMTLTVNEPTSVQIKIDKYVALGSLLIPASSLITILIVVAALIAFVFVEIYRRKRTKPAAAT